MHENGHATHISAIRNRPAYTDWTDTLFTEAFADVPSWSVYEPAWQRKYLGTELPVGVSLRGLYGSAMLDVAWSLYELRMLRDPAQDPNALWTDITRDYLHIKPHPEVAWWAVRVQLVSRPGYMVQLRPRLGADRRDAQGDDRRDRFVRCRQPEVARLDRPTSCCATARRRRPKQLMDELLGRPLSPDALLAEIKRIK